MEERQQVREEVCEISGYDIDGTLDRFMAKLSELKAQHPGELHIDFICGSYDERGSLDVYLLRAETDDEFAKRKSVEAERQRHETAREYENYLKMKARFEGSLNKE